jgi:hypothetical protein
MRPLHLHKIVPGLLLLLLCFHESRAQYNYAEMSRKTVYFGIHTGFNVGDFKVIHKKTLTENDSIRSLRPRLGPGFNLGIICNYQINKHFDLRAIPSLVFTDRVLEYETVNRKESIVRKSLSSIYMNFPLQVRYKSDPIKDFRIFVIAGMRYDFDLASNQKSRKALDIIKLKRHDLSVEYGLGMMFYFPYFILTPEFKMSHGVLDIHEPTEGLIYSRVLQKLYSRSFTFSINIEG